MGEQGKWGKTFGYHPARDFGRDVADAELLKNVDVEIEYSYSGTVVGIFIRRSKEA